MTENKENSEIRGLFIKNGNFRPYLMYVIGLTGIGLIYLSSELSSYWLGVLGMVVGSIGGYAARARALGIKPFRDESHPLIKKD